jgi:hypothetical protein
MPDMMEAGGTYFAAQKGVIRATTSGDYEEDGGPFKPLVNLGLEILDQLIRMSGGTPPARSATAASG